MFRPRSGSSPKNIERLWQTLRVASPFVLIAVMKLEGKSCSKMDQAFIFVPGWHGASATTTVSKHFETFVSIMEKH